MSAPWPVPRPIGSNCCAPHEPISRAFSCSTRIAKTPWAGFCDRRSANRVALSAKPGTIRESTTNWPVWWIQKPYAAWRHSWPNVHASLRTATTATRPSWNIGGSNARRPAPPRRTRPSSRLLPIWPTPMRPGASCFPFIGSFAKRPRRVPKIGLGDCRDGLAVP